MKLKFLLFVSLGLLFPIYGVSETYLLTPDESSIEDCKNLGMVDLFSLSKAYPTEKASRDYQINFLESDTNFSLSQSKSNKNFYSSVFKCVMNCYFESSISIDLGDMTFNYYESDIPRLGSPRIEKSCDGTLTSPKIDELE